MFSDLYDGLDLYSEIMKGENLNYNAELNICEIISCLPDFIESVKQ